MYITKLITRDSKNMGCYINDGGEVYPVVMEALHTKTVVDELLKSGYELMGLPYNFSKDGVSILDLPKVEFAEAGISEMEEQDMYLGLNDRYTNTELLAKIKVDSNVTLHEWKKCENKLKTREDLTSFLDLVEHGQIEDSNPYSYLPLNSFVSASALFSPEEYYAPENSRWRSLIEHRRILNVTQLKNLVGYLKENAELPDNYTSKQFVDAYFQWGICGLKFKVLGVEKEVTEILLGAEDDFSQTEETRPYRRKYHTTYLNSRGVIYREGIYNNSNWVPKTSSSMINDKIAEIREMGFNYIVPEQLSCKYRDEVTVIAGEDFKVSYDEGTILYEYEDEVILKPISVKSPTDDSRILNDTCLDLNVLEDEVRLESLCYLIKDNTTVGCENNSFDALTTIGMSKMSAMYYMVNHCDIRTKVEAALEEEDGAVLEDICFGFTKEMKADAAKNYGAEEALVLFQDYLVGKLDKGSLKWKVAKKILDDFYDGSLNIDSTASGEMMDMVVDSLKYKPYLYLVHSLGMSYEDIYKEIADVSVDTEYIDFTVGENIVRMPINKCNNKYNGYRTDLANYRALAGEQALVYTYVTSAIRELGNGTNETRHIALECDWLDIGDKKNLKILRPLIDRIDIALKEAVELNTPERWKNKMYSALGFYRGEALYSLLYKGTYTLNEKYLGGSTLTATLGERGDIRSCIRQVVTSTITFCDSIVNANGNISVYCVNAQVMPDYIIPRSGSIQEKPFIPLWIETTDSPSWLATKSRWFDKGYLPVKNWVGYKLRADELEIPQDIDFDGKRYYTANDPRSLTYYEKVANEFVKKYPNNKVLINPPTPYENMYVSEEDKDYDVASLEDREDTSRTHSWAISKLTTFTREDILDRQPHLRSIFKPERLELTGTHGFNTVPLITAEDLFRSTIKVADIFDIVDGTKVKGLTDGRLLFSDGTECTWDTLMTKYNTNNYAIKCIHGGKYLCLTEAGTWIEGVC